MMSIEISVKNKSGKSDAPSVSYITGDIFKYGAFDGTRLNINKTASDGSICMFNPEHIGRSISVNFGKDQIDLFLPLPTSEEDIDDLYETAKRVADFWSGDAEASENGIVFDPYNSMELADAAKAESLRKYKELIGGKYNNPIIFCALWALYLDDDDIKILADGGDLAAFRDYMHRMQNIDAYYAAPNICKTKYSDDLFGLYVFTQGVVSIVPSVPRVPYGAVNPKTGEPLVIDDWYICLYSYSEEKILGHVMYDDFLKSLRPEDYYRYDAQNILIKGLTRERIEFMLKKFGVSPPRT